MAQAFCSKGTADKPSLTHEMVKELDPFSNVEPQEQKFTNDEQLRSFLCDTTIYHNSMLDVEAHAAPARCTKIVCSIGHACRTVDGLLKLMKAGMNICRLDFSYGSLDYHKQTVKNIRDANAQMPPGSAIGIALDLKGARITTGEMEEGEEEEIKLELDKKITITSNESYKEKCTHETIWVDNETMINSVEIDRVLLLDDGNVTLRVETKTSDSLLCIIVNTGVVGSYMKVTMPNVPVHIPRLSEKDRKDIHFAVDNNFDMIFSSTIQNAEGVKEIRDILEDQKSSIKIIAKIVNLNGIRNFPEIIKEADGAMVSRGDLALEMPLEKVFIAQKLLFAAANRAGKPIICATQLLETMTIKPMANSSEDSDVANAVLDGADCIFLSRETSRGRFPEESVKHAAGLCRNAESCFNYLGMFKELKYLLPPPAEFIRSVALSAVSASLHNHASAIIVLATTTNEVAHVSSFRPRCPLVVVTRDASLAAQCLLYRAVFPVIAKGDAPQNWQEDVKAHVDQGVKAGESAGFIAKGTSVIVVNALLLEKQNKCQMHIFKC